jgi:hypothetical protein
MLALLKQCSHTIQNTAGVSSPGSFMTRKNSLTEKNQHFEMLAQLVSVQEKLLFMGSE